MYRPKTAELEDVRVRISRESWDQRVADARALQEQVLEIRRLVKLGGNQESAIQRVCPSSQRSKMLRALARHAEHGFDGLIDRRTPRERRISREQRLVIEVTRRAAPNVSVQRIREILVEQLNAPTSEATIKRELREAGLERPLGKPRSVNQALVEELGAAGLELIRAADQETGAVEDLVDGIVEVASNLPEPGEVEENERKLRNRHGQFTSRYNRSRRKRRGEAVAQNYRTSAEKAVEKDLGRMTLARQRRQTIVARLWGLMVMPALTHGNRIDELYGPIGRNLQGLCGHAYMPETLRKTVSEWTVAGCGPVLQEAHGKTWQRVSKQRWENDYQGLVVYVDNMTKPLWTKKFTKSAKVSSTGRIQPALVSMFIHSGAGVPIYFETHSGTAPLGARVLQVLEQLEARSDLSVGRLTVIDGEGCSASLLKKFKDAERDLITPLPSTLAVPERIRFGAGSAPQPYREGDRIREGTIMLKDSKDEEVVVEARAIVIEQRTKKEWTAFVTLADSEIWTARELADIYYLRWPNQEGVFRLANGAVGLNNVHGYGKRMVTNMSVVTKLDEFEPKVKKAEQSIASDKESMADCTEKLDELEKDLRGIRRIIDKREERVDHDLSSGRTETRRFSRAVSELREAVDQAHALERTKAKLKNRNEKTATRLDKTQTRVAKWSAEVAKLEGRRTVLEADVAQDVLYTSLKLTLAMLLHFVIVEYFPGRAMEWETFLSRLALLPGRRVTTDTTVTTIIEANERDVEFMNALEHACEIINARKLKQGHRRLVYTVEWPDPDEF